MAGSDYICPHKREPGKNKFAFLIRFGGVRTLQVGAVNLDRGLAGRNGRAVGLFDIDVPAKLACLGLSAYGRRNDNCESQVYKQVSVKHSRILPRIVRRWYYRRVP